MHIERPTAIASVCSCDGANLSNSSGQPTSGAWNPERAAQRLKELLFVTRRAWMTDMSLVGEHR
jgi:hypothetical protein